jgi:molybdopterin-guanine dinucleotide biosynthesis protein A
VSAGPDAVPISVAILAGGRSSRFGRDKLAEPIDGQPLLSRVIDAVRPIASEILVVAPPGTAPTVPLDVRVVHDPVAFEGPLVGARTGIRAATASIVVIVGGDMPDLVGAVIDLMASSLGDAEAVVLEHDGRRRPLPMAVRREPAHAALEELVDRGERRLRTLIDVLDARSIDEPTWRALDPSGATLRDIDTEADLR